MKREQIFLSKNFTVIESDIPFTLKFNIKDNTANSAEDIINFKSGWYIFDNNKLLPQYVDGVYNLPKYNCWIEYDETLGAVPNWYTCYINPKSVESLSSEVTELDPAQFARLRQDVQINGAKVDSFATATHEDLGAVKTSVDALQNSNHSDLGAVKTSVDSLGVLLTHDTEPGSVASANFFDLVRELDFFGSHFVGLFDVAGIEPVEVYRQERLIPSTRFEFFSPCFYISHLTIYNVVEQLRHWLVLQPCSHLKVSFENQDGADIDVRVNVNGIDSVFTINWGGLQMALYKVSLGNFKMVVD